MSAAGPVIAVTGATGFVGRALLDHALEAGCRVRAITRREQPAREGVEWIAGDLDARAALVRLCKGVDAVIHVAGVVNAPGLAGFEAGNVTGTLNVVEAAAKAGTRRLVFVSSLSAREPELSAYGASKARAEKLVMASGLDWTVVRPPAIYGPRDREMLALFKAARWGAVPMPHAAGRASYIHVDDLARLLLALVPSREETFGQVYEPDDGRPRGWSHGEIGALICGAVGRRPRVLHLPPRLLTLAAQASRGLLGDKAKLTPDRAGYMNHPDWVVSDAGKVSPSLWQPQVATDAGMKATAKWYRSHGWL